MCLYNRNTAANWKLRLYFMLSYSLMELAPKQIWQMWIFVSGSRVTSLRYILSLCVARVRNINTVQLVKVRFKSETTGLTPGGTSCKQKPGFQNQVGILCLALALFAFGCIHLGFIWFQDSKTYLKAPVTSVVRPNEHRAYSFRYVPAGNDVTKKTWFNWRAKFILVFNRYLASDGTTMVDINISPCKCLWSLHCSFTNSFKNDRNLG